MLSRRRYRPVTSGRCRSSHAAIASSCRRMSWQTRTVSSSPSLFCGFDYRAICRSPYVRPSCASRSQLLSSVPATGCCPSPGGAARLAREQRGVACRVPWDERFFRGPLPFPRRRPLRSSQRPAKRGPWEKLGRASWSRCRPAPAGEGERLTDGRKPRCSLPPIALQLYNLDCDGDFQDSSGGGTD